MIEGCKRKWKRGTLYDIRLNKISGEYVHDNVRASVPLVGDAKEVLSQLNASLSTSSPSFVVNESGQWWQDLRYFPLFLFLL